MNYCYPMLSHNLLCVALKWTKLKDDRPHRPTSRHVGYNPSHGEAGTTEDVVVNCSLLITLAFGTDIGFCAY